MESADRTNRTVTVVVACLATAMLMLDISVINTALSDIADGLDTGLTGLQWVIDAYTIPLAATVLTAGAVADRFGRRKLFLLGLVIFTVSSAVCGAAAERVVQVDPSTALCRRVSEAVEIVDALAQRSALN